MALPEYFNKWYSDALKAADHFPEGALKDRVEQLLDELKATIQFEFGG